MVQDWLLLLLGAKWWRTRCAYKCVLILHTQAPESSSSGRGRGRCGSRHSGRKHSPPSAIASDRCQKGTDTPAGNRARKQARKYCRRVSTGLIYEYRKLISHSDKCLNITQISAIYILVKKSYIRVNYCRPCVSFFVTPCIHSSIPPIQSSTPRI